MKLKKENHQGFFSNLVALIKDNKLSFAVYMTLRIIVFAVLVRCAFNRQWESVFVCVLTLLLFLLPPLIEKTFSVRLPTTLEIISFLFVFAAEILGEICCYYLKIPLWDTMLHTVNGFLFAAFGFCLVDIFNKSDKFKFQLSPVFLSIVAFCFSMTIGILWEFFEFSADLFLGTDMQKDFFITAISSTALDSQMTNTPFLIEDIVCCTLHCSDGSVIVLNSYLDVGLLDTMKDLLVNFVGALIFSVIGFFYVKHRGEGKIAKQFIPIYFEEEK